MSVTPAKRACAQLATNSTVVKKIAVEGNIATGKSTFLRILSESNPSYHTINEPLTKWTNLPPGEEDTSLSQRCGGNLLGLFYNDPKRWAYTFQAYACLSRLKAQLKSPPEDFPTGTKKPVLFYERSVYSDKFCFAQNCHDSGLINDTEWAVYCDWHSFMLEYLPLEFDGFIYLKSCPETAFERLKRRSRNEEKDVSVEYLASLHEKHQIWLEEGKTKPPTYVQRDVPVLVLDCNSEFETDKSRQNVLLEQVEQYLQRLEN